MESQINNIRLSQMIAIAANSMPTLRSYSERYSGMVNAYECLALILSESTNSVVASF